MTVKELSEFTGKNKSTICRWVAKTQVNSIIVKLQNATQYTPADYDLDEIESILTAGSMSKDAVRILMENARSKNIPATLESRPDESFLMMASFMKSQQEFMTAVLNRLDKIGTSQPLQIEQPKQDHFTLMAYCSLHHIKVNLSEAKKMGMDVKKLTIESGKEINTIPDERWGKVNSYPVEILEEYFSV